MKIIIRIFEPSTMLEELRLDVFKKLLKIIARNQPGPIRPLVV